MVSDRLGKTAIAVPSERPKGAGNPCLIVIAGPSLGQKYELKGSVVDIGRQEDCVISVPSAKVSRRHASVQRVIGRYTVADLGSTNGTYLNEQRLEKSQELNDGDIIKVGDLVLKYMENRLELQYHQQIISMATTDALTGVQNKRAFDQTFANSVLKASMEEAPLCLVLFDVDHFKSINDTHGHAAGDKVLKELGSISLATSKNGQLYRVGGEEFAILINALAPVGKAMAESLRGAVKARVVEHAGQSISVTISAGIAELLPGESARSLYQRADANLYVAKEAGRDRVGGP